MLKKALTQACVAFTLLVSLYSLIILLAYSADPDSSLAVSATRIVLCLPFSLTLGFANRLFDSKSLDTWLKTVLHFIAVMLAAYLCLLLPLGADLTPSTALVGIFLFALLYALIFGAVALSRGKRAQAANREKDYTPVYRKSTDKK